MSGAAIAVQTALVAALRASSELAAGLSGVFDGPPAQAALPYLAIGETVSGDWSTKDRRGRELRLAVTIWDDGTSAARLHRLMAAAEDAIEGMATVPDGFQLVSLAFQRARIVRDPAGPWAGLIEYRARVLEG